MPGLIDMSDLTALTTALFAGLAVLAAAFFKYMSAREKASQKEREDARKDFEKIISTFTKSIDHLTEASNRGAVAQEQAAQEAKERNGHLAELQLASQKMIADNLNAIHHVSEQKVIHQTVENETVKKKEKK